MQRGEHVSWIRAFHQPVTYLGVTLGAVIIAGLAYLIHKDEQDAYNVAVRTGTNLAQVFEGYMARTFKNADNTLRAMRATYLQNPSTFDLGAWSRNPDFRNDLTLQLSIVGADGRIAASTSASDIIGTDLGAREHFQWLLRNSADDVFITKPFKMLNGQLVIILSRRITKADGSFGGMVSAAIDPIELQKFYDALDLGRASTASLVGFDGILRTRGGGSPEFSAKIGRPLATSGVLARYKEAPTGTYWNVGGQVDAIRRLVTYRVIDGFPLIALVGLAKSDIYKYAEQNARIYYAIGSGLLLTIGIAIGFAAVRERKLVAVSRSLTVSNDRFEAAMANLPQGFCLFDQDRILRACNDAYWTTYGLSSEQTRIGMTVNEVIDARVKAGCGPRDMSSYVERLRDARRYGKAYFEEELCNGRTILISVGLIPGGGWVAVHQDITAQKKAEGEITHLAHYDALTSLSNRLLFLRHVNDAMARCRANDAAFAVHILDLDRFKEVNDTLGHACGDQLLRIVAQRLLGVIGPNDIVGRLGGDEFAILQPLGENTAEDARALADRVLTVFADPFDLNEHRLNIETSIGIALAPDNGDEAEQLLKTADLALYKAKSEGRNTYRLFEPEMEMEVRDRHALQIDLRHALASDQLELHYQPIVDAKTQELSGFEALLRWRHPLRGLVMPDKFIPIAEETGLIAPLGEWVLRKACFDAATWPKHLSIAVNLSSEQFRRGDIGRAVECALAESSLSPQRLELEVTETLLLQNNEKNIGLLHRLRELGVCIALDDFGTGYSSLSYLQSFPFDKIKIDRSFVANLSSRTDCAAIISAVTSLARMLNIKTTAEGVETEEQMLLLRAAGCTQMQGFLFGRPRRKAELDFDGQVKTVSVA